MCKLCQNTGKTMEILAEGPFVSLEAGLTSQSRLFLVAVGDDYTERYYPKYCPECGKPLINTTYNKESL